jgi:glycosyltransferase involved in cell wall biosynthesis
MRRRQGNAKNWLSAEREMPDVSVVMPAMDEEGTIGVCIEKVMGVFAEQQLDGEIIVADNSDDRTPEIARSLGAILWPGLHWALFDVRYHTFYRPVYVMGCKIDRLWEN